MGRELKRVPLDFNWPLHKLWDGYLNPFGGHCPEDQRTCFGGYTAAGKWLDAISGLIALIGSEGALNTPQKLAHFTRTRRTYPHPYLQEWGQSPRTEVPRDVHARIRELEPSGARFEALGRYLRDNPPKLLELTPEVSVLVTGLAGRAPEVFGHDACDRYSISQKLKVTAGVPETWGFCTICEGHADDPAQRSAAEAWEATEPPSGAGFQLWTNTNEGAPISPVFKSLDELCDWCVTGATTFASIRATAEEWRQMLSPGGLVAATLGMEDGSTIVLL